MTKSKAQFIRQTFHEPNAFQTMPMDNKAVYYEVIRFGSLAFCEIL